MSVQNSVFVGNIPYEATETQLKDFLDTIGGVVQFKLQYDDKTGKSMGYGFCEFKDKEHAETAIKNLHGADFQGRQLIVGKKHGKKNNRSEAPTGNMKNHHQTRKTANTGESINNTLREKMTDKQLYQILAQFKSLIQQNPTMTQHILQTNPQLTYALLQAQVILGIAPNIVQEILKMKTGGPGGNTGGVQPTPSSNPNNRMNPSYNPQQPMNNPNTTLPPNNMMPNMFNMYGNKAPTMVNPGVLNPTMTAPLLTPTMVNPGLVNKQDEQLISFLIYIVNTPTPQIVNCAVEQQMQILDILKKILVHPIFTTTLNPQQQQKVLEVANAINVKNQRN